jgi:hypothetical protein
VVGRLACVCVLTSSSLCVQAIAEVLWSSEPTRRGGLTRRHVTGIASPSRDPDAGSRDANIVTVNTASAPSPRLGRGCQLGRRLGRGWAVGWDAAGPSARTLLRCHRRAMHEMRSARAQRDRRDGDGGRRRRRRASAGSKRLDRRRDQATRARGAARCVSRRSGAARCEPRRCVCRAAALAPRRRPVQHKSARAGVPRPRAAVDVHMRPMNKAEVEKGSI